MNKKTKTLILSIVVTLILLLTFTVTYAAFVYRQTGEDNHQLVLGDIYMHYTETNSGIDIDNMMPININDYTTYEVNPVMATQELNELTKCINFFTEIGISNELDAGSTTETFCQGTGTIGGGNTMQDFVEIAAPDELIQEMLSINIIIEENGSYKVNPVMATQELNELTRCINYLTETGINNVLDAGSTTETFCQGTGTVDGGNTMQALVETAPDELIQEMLSINIIIEENGSYKVNPVMATQELNELTRCVNYFTGFNLDEGSTTELFCQGTGTIDGMTFQQIWDNSSQDDEFMNFVGNKLIVNNIIILQIKNLPYFEFTISGKNTYKQKDIWYDVVLNHGDVPEGKLEENRINDESLRFALLEVNGENQKNIFNNRSYSSLENKRIHVETIPKNTTEEINKTYRLYMWIDDSVVIGNVNEDYTTDEWKDVFASIKVSVTGDFNEKVMDTDESCFTVGTVDYDGDIGVAITDYDASCGSDVVIPEMIKGYKVVEIGNCDSNIITQLNNLENDKSFNNLLFKDNFNNGVLIEIVECGSFQSKGLTSIKIPNSVKTIKLQALYGNQLTSVEIPNSVTIIEQNAFAENQLTDVTFEENSRLVMIGNYAFSGNNLTSVEIPDSVATIGNYAFRSNQLKTVTIGSGIQYIDSSAFYRTSDSNPNLESITFTNKTCDEIKNIEASSTDSTKNFPWLDADSPYYQEGYKSTIIGTDGECSY